jgi:hypothetical protein
MVDKVGIGFIGFALLFGILGWASRNRWSFCIVGQHGIWNAHSIVGLVCILRVVVYSVYESELLLSLPSCSSRSTLDFSGMKFPPFSENGVFGPDVPSPRTRHQGPGLRSVHDGFLFLDLPHPPSSVQCLLCSPCLRRQSRALCHSTQSSHFPGIGLATQVYRRLGPLPRRQLPNYCLGATAPLPNHVLVRPFQCCVGAASSPSRASSATSPRRQRRASASSISTPRWHNGMPILRLRRPTREAKPGPWPRRRSSLRLRSRLHGADPLS